MCKYAVLLLVLTLTINSSYAFNSKLKMNNPNYTVATYESKENRRGYYPPSHNHYYPQRDYLSHGNLSALEKYALNKTFKRENDLTRLERLENLAFGATQIGDLDSRYANVEQAILSRPKYKTKNSILSNLAGYFNGRPTGFTPSISDNVYVPAMGLPAGLGFSSFGGNFYPSPGYINQNFEQYSNGPFSGGWGMSNHNFGNGTSVRILD